jgi:ribonuclease HI
MAAHPWKIWIDGASRGNPGEAAYAVVIQRPNVPDLEEADRLGIKTNNIAEYTALLKALERAAQLGGSRLEIFSDSELLVKQMNGEYRVKNEDLKELHALATKQVEHFDRVALSHVRREQNARADALCNAALDGRPVQPKPLNPKIVLAANEISPQSSKTAPHTQVLHCLQKAAEAWSKSGNAAEPAPEAVWREIWEILTSAALGE